MRKTSIFITSLVLLLVLVACSNTGDEIPGDITNQEIGHEILDDDPVDAFEKNNPRFDEALKPFPSLNQQNGESKALDSLKAEEVFQWIVQTQDIYQGGMASQTSFTQEQRDKIEKWLSDYLSDELLQARLEKAMKPVEGGYRIAYAYDVYDFNIHSIEEVVHLQLDQVSNDTITLTADLIVRVEQPIRVVYEISHVDGTAKLTGYEFTMLEKSGE